MCVGGLVKGFRLDGGSGRGGVRWGVGLVAGVRGM